jgi:hypothetical protein
MSALGFNMNMGHWAVMMSAGLLLQAQAALLVWYCNDEAKDYKKTTEDFQKQFPNAFMPWRHPPIIAFAGLFVGILGVFFFVVGIRALINS